MTVVDESVVVPMDELQQTVAAAAAKQDGHLIDPVSVIRKSGSVKVTITPCQPKTLSHLPKRPPVDIAFSDLEYTVTEGNKKSEYNIIAIMTVNYVRKVTRIRDFGLGHLMRRSIRIVKEKEGKPGNLNRHVDRMEEEKGLTTEKIRVWRSGFSNFPPSLPQAPFSSTFWTFVYLQPSYY